MHRLILVFSALFMLCWQCKPVDRSEINKIKPVDLGYTSEMSKLAYDFGDQRNIDSLNAYLNSRHSREKYQGIKTMFSFYDSTLLNPLLRQLSAPEPEIRRATLYAIGQSHDVKALPDLMRMYRDTSSSAIALRGLILETVGKIGGAEELKLLSTIQTFTAEDTALVIGLARAIYDLQLRGHNSQQATEQMMNLVWASEIPAAQLYVAHYLGRSGSLKLGPYEGKIREIALNHKNPEIRMAIARSFRHVQNDFGFQTLLDWFPKETDYRTRIEILRALSRFSDRPLGDFLNTALKDKNTHVKRLAAELLITRLDKKDALKLRQRMRTATKLDPITRASLYGAANRNLSNAYGITKVNMNDEIKTLVDKTKDLYEKAQFYRALSFWPGNIDYLLDQYDIEKHAIINTTILQSLLHHCGTDEGKIIYSGYQGVLRQKLAKHFLKIFDKKDVGSMAVAAGTLASEPRKWKPYFRDIDFLTRSLTRLDLPKEYETYLEVIKAINALDPARNITPDAPQYNHPIDWELFKELSPIVKAEIKTNKGSMEVELYIEDAPGSVTNWVQLARSDFFNGKYFHRVVPNFVVQSGCPRGDGYGSLDYTIRSEFNPLRYDQAGVIGMASAGPDTEGTQWFITHSATPHLNGRYTIIGQVTDGFDVLQKTQQGDIVEEVSIK